MTKNALCPRSGSLAFTRADLCARMAPIDSYGPTGFGSALAEGLSALASVSLQALSALRNKTVG